MEIRPARLQADLDAVAAFSEAAPSTGFSRPTFTEPWRAARDYIEREAVRAGCRVRIDAAGNLHARPAARTWEEPLWLSGSHIDSVPTGGRYDGVVGIVAALEVLRAAPAAPLELIIFAEEEGTTFNLGMLGSRAWTGALDAAGLAAVRNAAGLNYLEAGAAHGVRPAALAAEGLVPAHYRGFIELHVEQGPRLWKERRPLAVVRAISGRRQFRATVTGQSNHAGSTGMHDRADALAGAAEMIVALERLGLELDGRVPHTVVTVGRMDAEPNALNVIAGRAVFLIDFRSPEEGTLEDGEQRIRGLIAEVAARRGLRAEVARTEMLAPTPLDAGICARLRDAAVRCGVQPVPETVSGALHDAAIVAPRLPTAMLFIASRDGLSHHPDEYSELGDIAQAARVLGEAVST